MVVMEDVTEEEEVVDKVTTMAAELVFSVDAQKSFFLHLRSSSLFSITGQAGSKNSQSTGRSTSSSNIDNQFFPRYISNIP